MRPHTRMGMGGRRAARRRRIRRAAAPSPITVPALRERPSERPLGLAGLKKLKEHIVEIE